MASWEVTIKIAILGSGPSALMCADHLASAGANVTVFEKRKGIAWKLYVAGSSGLNITNSLPLEEFAQRYSASKNFWKSALRYFGPQEWIGFIENDLGLGTFLGTSGRYFVETMHAAKLIRNWRKRLESKGVGFAFDHECVDFAKVDTKVRIDFSNQPSQSWDAVVFALGGASWEQSPVQWPQFFVQKGISFSTFAPSNTGYELAWTQAFLNEAEAKPIKNIRLRSSRGDMLGDLVITSYGLEGTPVYTLGEVGTLSLDLKPDLSEKELVQKLSSVRENLSPMRRVSKKISLSVGAKALLFHFTPDDVRNDIHKLAHFIKNVPLNFLRPRPLSESISAKGGIRWDELDDGLQLRKFPNVYCIGEMVDWDAPTGGFLIQGSVTQGAWCAQEILKKILKDKQ